MYYQIFVKDGLFLEAERNLKCLTLVKVIFFLQLSFSGLENSQLTGSWQMSQFSRRVRKKTLVITGLSVLLQCLVILWRLSWELLKNTWKIMLRSLPTWANEGKVRLNFLLCQNYSSSRPREASSCNLFGCQQSFWFSVSQHPMQNVQHTAGQKHSMIAYKSGSKGYSQCDYIVQADSH